MTLADAKILFSSEFYFVCCHTFQMPSLFYPLNCEQIIDELFIVRIQHAKCAHTNENRKSFSVRRKKKLCLTLFWYHLSLSRTLHTHYILSNFRVVEIVCRESVARVSHWLTHFDRLLMHSISNGKLKNPHNQ